MDDPFADDTADDKKKAMGAASVDDPFAKVTSPDELDGGAGKKAKKPAAKGRAAAAKPAEDMAAGEARDPFGGNTVVDPANIGAEGAAAPKAGVAGKRVPAKRVSRAKAGAQAMAEDEDPFGAGGAPVKPAMAEEDPFGGANNNNN